MVILPHPSTPSQRPAARLAEGWLAKAVSALGAFTGPKLWPCRPPITCGESGFALGSKARESFTVRPRYAVAHAHASSVRSQGSTSQSLPSPLTSCRAGRLRIAIEQSATSRFKGSQATSILRS